MVVTTTIIQRVTGTKSMITCLAPYFSVSSSSSVSTSWSLSGGPALLFTAIWTEGHSSEDILTPKGRSVSQYSPAWLAGWWAGWRQGWACRRARPGSLTEPAPTSRCRSRRRCPRSSWPELKRAAHVLYSGVWDCGAGPGAGGPWCFRGHALRYLLARARTHKTSDTRSGRVF